MSSYNILVNRTHLLPTTYIPDDLVDSYIPFDACFGDPKRLLREKAAKASRLLMDACKGDGLFLYGISGYRSYERQKEIFDNSMTTKGEQHTMQYIAFPGASEHQTGLALDVSCSSVKFDLVEAFDQTPEGKWLVKNAPLYGFILRYPKGKEEITGYSYEPWHIRYVSRSLALYLSITGQTLDEYHELHEQAGSDFN